MERTKKVEKVETLEDGRIRWKKVGGGSLHLKNRIIKPGQVFLAYPHEIPEAFRDNIIAIDKLPEEKPVIGVKATFTIEKKVGQYYNVVNSSGKVMNEKGLKIEEAEKLKATLEA